MLPASVAEYILVHEMAHPHEPRHSKAFWRRLARAVQDGEERKERKDWFAVDGMRYGL